ncbi:helix-turn-helix transcriptional regulator [Candidatus Bathyarchaeota archaeon]|nr:helix-turn-helix transcriptional regulator [Candidatus Bathyarchaeota archaeon]
MSRKLIVLLLAVVLSLAAAVQQPAEPQLNAGISGTYNGPDRLNPSRVLREPRVVRLMLDLAETPRDRAWLASNLAGGEITMDDLQTLGLVREENGRFVIAFNLFTRADVMKVRQVAGLRTESLAEAYLTHRAEFEQALARYNMPDVDPQTIAYILIGCFSLDWDGLDVTATKKYRVEVRERPGLGTFNVWAEEKTPELSLEGVYWGSHNEYFPEVVLTSFGDHFSLPRNAFPDLLWRAEGTNWPEKMPEPLRDSLRFVEVDGWTNQVRQIGRLMLALRGGPQTPADLAKTIGLDESEIQHALALLAEVDYIRQEDGRSAAMIPVLTVQDRPMMDDVLRISRQIFSDWLAANYEPIRKDLAGITPLRYGVPYDEVFTQVWHYLFGIANRRLVETGFFADPYAQTRKFKGFVPAVWDPSLWNR